MSRISERTVRQVYDESVETKYAETIWPVYETYVLRPGKKGAPRYIVAPNAAAKRLNGEVRYIDPLSKGYAGLFLEFARWFDTQDERADDFAVTLDTARNRDAALAWAHDYGVLGLGTNPGSDSAVGGGLVSSSLQIAARLLGTPELGHDGTRAYRMSAEGGERETVETFVLKAREANVVLKLYEAATAPKPNIDAIKRFMSPERSFFYLPARHGRPAPSELETWAKDADSARRWGLAVVEEAVARNTERDVYRIVLGEPYSYKEGWGFKSLLGAMWLQMQTFMLGEDNLCRGCGELYPKTRRNRQYCNLGCGSRYRSKKNYHEGSGRSSKQARKAKRYRREG